MEASDSANFPPGDGPCVAVGVFDSGEQADEYALVIFAMGLECFVEDLEPPDCAPRFVLLAPAAHADAIRAELAAYTEQQSGHTQEPAVSDPPVAPTRWGLVLLWGLTLLAVYLIQCLDPAVTERFRNSSQALFAQGQWWRPLTALFLHADAAHLFGNLLFSVALFSLVTSALGSRTGWLLILASGTIGNALTAWFHHPSSYESLGASTAVFGALGILTGLSTSAAWRSRARRHPIHLLLPAVSGMILLSWLGSGEAPVDVLSHLLGFLTGGFLGWMATWTRLRRTASQ